VPEGTKGVVITQVDDSSDAATKGLQRLDIVLAAGSGAISSRADLEAAVKAAKSAGREALLLRVQRSGQPALYVPIRLR
jgi:serine protease Do